MRLIAWSDLHSEEHEDFSYQLPDGMNSRLADCIDVIPKVAYYRDKYECDIVLFLGDMFHTPQVLSTVVFQETYKRLEKLAATSKLMIIMAGNHDMASITADGIPVSTIYALRQLPNTKVVIGKYRPVFLAEHNVVIHCIPYIKDPKQLDVNIERAREGIIQAHGHSFPKAQIILTHMSFAQAVNGPNEIMLKTSYDVNKLRKLGTQKILSGHHHHPQDEGDWSIIGSPIQMNMLDRGDRRGFLIYNTKTNKTTRIWLNGSRFFLYEVNSLRRFEKLEREQEAYRGGYVRVMLTQGVVPEAKIHRLLEKHAKMYKIIPVKNIKSEMRNAAVSKKAMANIGNLSEVIPAYVDHVAPKGLKAERLTTIGRRLIKGT